MSGNKPEWSNSQRDLAFYIAALQNREPVEKKEAFPAVETEKAEGKHVEEKHEVFKPEENKRITEGKRLFRMKRWENALGEFQLVNAEKANAGNSSTNMMIPPVKNQDILKQGSISMPIGIRG